MPHDFESGNSIDGELIVSFGINNNNIYLGDLPLLQPSSDPAGDKSVGTLLVDLEEKIRDYRGDVDNLALVQFCSTHMQVDREVLKTFLEEYFANPNSCEVGAISQVLQTAYVRGADESVNDYLNSLPQLNVQILARVVIGRPGDTEVYGRYPDGRIVLCAASHGKGNFLGASTIIEPVMEDFEKFGDNVIQFTVPDSK